jgi:hypothetical protein
MKTKAGKPVYPYGPPDGTADRPKYAFDDCRNNTHRKGRMFSRITSWIASFDGSRTRAARRRKTDEVRQIRLEEIRRIRARLDRKAARKVQRREQNR